MAALTTEVPIKQVGDYVSQAQIGVDGAAAKIYESAMVCALTATGYAVKAGVASTGPVLGVAQFSVDNSAGSDGDLSVDILQGLFWRPNAGTVTQAHYGKVIYAANDQDVTATKSTNPIAGVCLGVDSTQGVLVLIHGPLNHALQGMTDLASVANGFGAALVGVEDAAGKFTGTNVEAVLAEIMTQLAGVTGTTGANLVGYDDSGSKTSAATVANALDEIYVDATSTLGTIEIPLGTITDADGDFTKFADGGADGMTIADSKAVCFRINNAGPPPQNLCSFAIPYDANVTADMTLNFMCSKSGATAGDATTITAALYNQVDGALHDADANYGGATSALVGDAAAKTIDVITLTLANANLPAAGSNVSMSFAPTNGTLGTDDLLIHRIWVTYTRKLRAS